MMDVLSTEITTLQAEFCTAVADPNRVQIVYQLAGGPRNVKSLARQLGLSSSATSRHLKVLREKELVATRREGHTVYYSLAEPQLIDALNIFLNILNNQLTHRANLITLERTCDDSVA
jgi:ArsR family transcriptional regulator